jgi:hypothetical protein
MKLTGLKSRNWQDMFLGGAILAAFVVIAVIAALVAIAKWNGEAKPGAPSNHAQQMGE